MPKRKAARKNNPCAEIKSVDALRRRVKRKVSAEGARMKAAVFHGPQPAAHYRSKLRSMTRRITKSWSALVASGVCHSDLHVIDGLWPQPTPSVLGHEGAGIVEKVGSGGRLRQARRPRDLLPIGLLRLLRGLHVRRSPSVHQPGRHPARPRVASRGCRKAARRCTRMPTSRRYAEKMLVHENALVKITNEMPLDRAALIGCGVTTGMGAVLEHGQNRTRFEGRGVRMRRGRHCGDPGRANRRRPANHRR